MAGNEIHVSTRDKPGDYDAFETAKPNEPIFTIQGGDPFGPATVQFWAEEARRAARMLQSGPADFEPTVEHPEYEPSEADNARAEKLLRKATSAEMVSWSMITYQRGHTEIPPEVRARYNEDQPLAEDRFASRKIMIASAAAIHNALSIANDVAEQLDSLDLNSDAVRDIKNAVGILKAAADKIEPRRDMERS